MAGLSSRAFNSAPTFRGALLNALHKSRATYSYNSLTGVILILTRWTNGNPNAGSSFQCPDAGLFDSYSDFRISFDRRFSHYITAFPRACTHPANLRGRTRKFMQNSGARVGFCLSGSLLNSFQLLDSLPISICERYWLACEFLHSPNRLRIPAVVHTRHLKDHNVCHLHLNYIQPCLSFSPC